MVSYAFPDEVAETNWLLEDLWRDREATGLGWGEYALLYRAHVTGQYLETRCIEAGIPCRLAQGQSVRDDELIAFVVSSLRVIRAPEDPVAVEGFAEQVLPRPLIEQVQARYHDLDLVSALRAFARAARARGDADARKAWRFIFHVENLAALGRTHDTLPMLVDELLSQRIGRYRNPLEERAGELSDPADFPGAVALAERIAATTACRGAVWVEPDRGIEIPIIRLLQGALGGDVRRLEPGDLPLARRPACCPPVPSGRSRSSRRSSSTTAGTWKTRSRTTWPSTWRPPTRRSPTARWWRSPRCGCAAGKWSSGSRGGCVPTGRSAARRARSTASTTRTSATSRPSSRSGPRSAAFVGDDLLVAHNGQYFDMPVLRRLAAELPGMDEPRLLRHPAAGALAAGRERQAGGPRPPLRRRDRSLAPRARRLPWRSPV